MKLGLQIHKLVSQKSMFLGTLGASLLGNLLASKGAIRAGEVAIRAA